MTKRRVRSNGEIKWDGRRLYLSEVLAQEWIGLAPAADGIWELYYRFHPLGQLDERTRKIQTVTGWHNKRM